MRTLRNAGLVATLILTLYACGGSGGGSNSASPGEAACPGLDCGRDDPDPPAPLACGGIAGTTCPNGYRCVDDSADNCDAATGADCGGICLLGEDIPDCGGLAGGACPEGYDCTDDPDDDCAGGPAVDCPGICTPKATPACDDDADCPQLDARCAVCADGSVSCPRTGCTNGQCTIEVGACAPPPACDGIAGFVCPEGFACIDDPADNCDPANLGADCGGVCVPVEQPPPCGQGGESCPPDSKCVDDPNDECRPDAAGNNCPLVCMPVTAEECTDDSDCPQLRAPCSECRDGSAACPQSFCDHGRCNVSFPTCPPPVICGADGQACKPGHVCADDPNDACDPAIGDVRCSGICVDEHPPRVCGGFAGETCPDGYACADDPGDDCDPNAGGADCLGICQPDGSPECRADSDCPHVLAPCVECPDGSFACPIGLCRNGKCDASFTSCPDRGFCGGIAGFPCPPGFTCIDAPNDECDPQNGGADCGGICVREERPRPCGGFAGDTCPEGYECVDDPDDCDPNVGGADCPGSCRPAPPPPCRDDVVCPVIGAPCILCADGTTACPSSFCVDGQCQAKVETCGDER